MGLKLRDQGVIINAVTIFLKQLESSMSSLQNKDKLEKKTNVKQMGNYSDQKTVKSKKVRNLLKSVPTRYVGMVICTNAAIPNKCFKERLQLDYFRIFLCDRKEAAIALSRTITTL